MSTRPPADRWLAARSILWTVLAPGMVAGYVPWRFFGLAEVRVDPTRPAHLAGLLALLVGAAFLALCIVEFARRGRGTLSPVDPPRRLVVSGPYRVVRNPMYWSVTAILCGEVLLSGSLQLLTYLLGWFAVVNLVVIGYEEPRLRRQFGEDYRRYCGEVRRWLPRWPG